MLLEQADPPTVCDLRWYLDGRSGREAFLQGHIPGAVFVDLEQVCCEQTADSSRGRHPFASPGAFVNAIASHGVNRESVVVVYDDQCGSVAARLWFMLDCLGVCSWILDGGVQAWNGRLEPGWSDPIGVEPWEPPFKTWPTDKVVDTQTVRLLIEQGERTIFDARGKERYLGEIEPVDRVAGHIPTAVSLPWTDLVTESGVVNATEVCSRFQDFEDSPVVSCGSGVTACFLAAVRRHGGLGDAAVYEGSYSGWSADPARYVERGDPGPRP